MLQIDNKWPFFHRDKSVYTDGMPKGYLTTKQAAMRLKTTLQAVQRLIERGRLPAEKFGPVWMISEADLAQFTRSKRGRKPKLPLD